MSDRTITPSEFAEAFRAWARVNKHVGDEERGFIDRAMTEFAASVPSIALAPDEACKAADEFIATLPAEDRARASSLKFSIRKSCLLDRLIYCGEPLRTVKCPQHKGVWSGIQFFGEQCACRGSCGCTTGWLPAEAKP